MTRRALSLPFALAFGLQFAANGRAADDPRTALAFVQGLRDRGYHDLAIDYLAALRADPALPPEIKGTLDFEEGRALIDAATHGSDPDVAREQLDRARGRLDAYIKANPNKSQTIEALVELAHLLYERGRNVAIVADEAKTPAEKEAKLLEARGFYASARNAYNDAYGRLEAKFKVFPNFIDDGTPLKAEKDRVHGALMNAELQRAVVDYEEAQTFPLGSPRRGEILEAAGKAFEDVYKRYRTQLAGIHARMWQGKCHEERGEFGPAKGIYDELLDHKDPLLLPLQKKVDYFRIILMGKRKDYALAADEAVNWLQAFPKDRRSYEALGVQFELAKDILAQLPDAAPAEKERARKRAVESLTEVVRFTSPYKAEALALLRKVAPKAAISAASIANLGFDEAVAQANEAVSTQEYDKAILLLRLALKKGTGTQPIEKVNNARYLSAFSLYMSNRYYEAAVMAEHLARRYPGGEFSAKATGIGIPAIIDAYNIYTVGDRTADLRRVEALAKYTAETWPDSEQGDTGRMTGGQVAIGAGRYADAIAAFESVRSSSTKWVDAQGYAADAHWKLAVSLREKDPASKPAEAEVQKALALYRTALKTRRDSGAGDVDLALIGNACDLATISLEVGKADEALKLLDPIAKTLGTASRPASLNAAYARVMATRLRGHVAAGQVDQAIVDMNLLEGSGATGDRAQLYFALGTLLEKEMEALRRANNTAALNRTQAAYRKFLKALVESKSGQTFESLFWAGSNLLNLNAFDEAAGVFDQILKVYGDDKPFLDRPGSEDRLRRARLKQVSALRGKGQFADAETKLAALTKPDPRRLDVQMEKGYLLSDQARAKKGSWSVAFNHWQALAAKFRNQSPKPVDYYEVWYQAAKALQADGKSTLAKQTLGGVMRLSPQVGGPEMKAKYQELSAQLK